MSNESSVRKLVSRFVAVVMVTQSIFYLLATGSASAATPYTASDVLGQTLADEITSTLSSGKADSSVASNAGLDRPYDLEVDTVNHRLFVADYNNHRVLVYNLNSSNVLLDRQADYVLGQANFTESVFTPNTDQLTASNFHSPSSLAFDSVNNRLFVGDGGWQRVLVFDTTVITNNEAAVNVLGQTGLTTWNSGFDNTKEFRVDDIAFDSIAGYLYVADGNWHRVTIFDVNAITNGESAINVLGQADFSGTLNDTNSSGFYSPAALVVDETDRRLFVGEKYNNRVLVFDITAISNNEAATHVLGQADFVTDTFATDQKGFLYPDSVAYDDANNLLYVFDESYRVLVFDVSTGTIANNQDASYVLGQANFTTATSDLNAKGFGTYFGAGLAYSNDQLFVADTIYNRVLIFDTSTIVNNEDAVDLLGQTDINSDPVYTQANINNNQWGSPNEYGFANDQSNGGGGTDIDTVNHRLFVADYYNNRVLVFNLDNNNDLIDYAADYVLGQANFSTRTSGNSATQLDGPQDVAYDPVNNRLFVQDLYNDRINVFDVSSITNGEAAVNSLGSASPGASGGGGSSASEFGYMDQQGLELDPTTQRLFVMDTGNSQRIMIFDVSTITNGEDAVYAIGTSDINTSGSGTCDATGISGYYSSGIAVDTARQLLFAANDDCNTVMVYDLNNLATGMSASYVLGCVDYDCSTPANEAGTFDHATAIAYDQEHQLLYVVDEGYYRIMVFDVSTITNGEDAVGVIGKSDFSADYTYGTSSSAFHFAYNGNGVFDKSNRRMYFPDNDNNRILIFDFANISLGTGDPDTPATIPEAQFGEPYNYALPITGTQGSYSCALTSGTLPQGVTLSSGCVISGTPASNTVYTFAVTVTDDNGTAGSFSDTQTLSLTVVHGATLSNTGYNILVFPIIGLVMMAGAIGTRKLGLKSNKTS